MKSLFSYGPMIYDVLLEMGTLVGGHYQCWAYEAQSEAEAEHWNDQAEKIRQQVRAVNSDDPEQVTRTLDQLTELWKSLPDNAPELSL